MGSRDSDAVIVAVLDDNGAITSVRRYRKREADRCERDIAELHKQGRFLRLTFIERHDGMQLEEPERKRIRSVVKP